MVQQELCNLRQDGRRRLFGRLCAGPQAGELLLAARRQVVTKLSIYLAPTGTSGQQVLKGVIYADSSGKPAALLGVSEQLTFSSTNSAGWYDLVFPSPVKLAAGNYWIGVIAGSSGNVAGFRYDSVAGSRRSQLEHLHIGPHQPVRRNHH